MDALKGQSRKIHERDMDKRYHRRMILRKIPL